MLQGRCRALGTVLRAARTALQKSCRDGTVRCRDGAIRCRNDAAGTALQGRRCILHGNRNPGTISSRMRWIFFTRDSVVEKPN